MYKCEAGAKNLKDGFAGLEGLNSFKNLIGILVCLVFSVSSVCFAQESPPQIYHLKTGHTVVIKEIHSNPIVTVDTWINTGSLNENPQNNGVSHFLEHLMFKGTKNYKTGEIDKILESKGGRFNAATSKDFTHFYITIPSKDTETAIKLNADMLLNATFPDAELNKERKVVQEEIRRSEDSPDSKLFDNLISMIFKTHPYRYTTLGPASNIEKMPRKKILEYYRYYYAPSNMTTVVVGDVDTKKTLCMLEENYKAEVANKIVLPKFKREISSLKPQIKIARDKVNFGYLFMGFKGVTINDIKESYALNIAASILGDGKSSRLYQTLKEKLNLVSSIDAGHYTLRDDSILYISADFSPSKYNQVKDIIQNELKKLGETKISDEELNRAKTRTERAFVYENESIEEIAGSIGYVMALEGSIDSYNNHLKYVNAVTADDIQKVAQKYIKPSAMALSVLLPPESKSNNLNGKITGGAAKQFKEQNLCPCKNAKFVPKRVASNIIKPCAVSVEPKTIKNGAQKTVLKTGMVLITNPNASNDIISLSVFVKGGKLLDSPAGITNLLIKTLLQGTTTRSAYEITKDVESLGIIISPVLDSDCFEIRLKSTRADFDKAFEILADVINNPAFSPEYVEKGKKDIVQDIIKSRDKPMSKVSEGFNRAMYPNHPYGNIGEVLEKSVSSLSREQLIDFHKKIFIPKNMVVAVSGNINQKEIVQKFSEAFPSTLGEKLSLKFSPELKKFPSDKIIFQKDETAAAWMLIGWPVEGINNIKDYAALQVVDSLLGGGMSSRLYKTFREKQGLCYSVGSSYSSKMDGSFFAMYIGTGPKNIELVKSKFLQEMTRLKTEIVSKDELNDAKQKLIGNFLLSQETNQEKAHYLGYFETIDKGCGFTYDFPDLINSVTSEAVMSASNKYFNSPYALSIVAPEMRSGSVKK